MTGRDLRIRRFTPIAEKALRLIPADIGRPIADLKPRVNVPDLEEVVHQVVDTLQPYEREVEDHEGRSYPRKRQPGAVGHDTRSADANPAATDRGSGRTRRLPDSSDARLRRQGPGQFVTAMIDLSDLVREISALVRTSISKAVDVKLDLAPHLPPIEADPAQIQQLLMNLVINGAEQKKTLITWKWHSSS